MQLLLSCLEASRASPTTFARLRIEMFPLRWNQADETGSCDISVSMVNLSTFCLIKTQIYCLIKSLPHLFVAACDLSQF